MPANNRLNNLLDGLDLPPPKPRPPKPGAKPTRTQMAEWAGVSARTVIRWSKMDGFPAAGTQDDLLLWLATQPDIRLNDTTAQRIAEARARAEDPDDDDTTDPEEEAELDAASSPQEIGRLNRLRESKLEHEIAKLQTQISQNRKKLAEDALALVIDPITEAMVDVQKTLTGFKLPLDQQLTINSVIDQHITKLDNLIKELDL